MDLGASKRCQDLIARVEVVDMAGPKEVAQAADRSHRSRKEVNECVELFLCLCEGC